MAIKTAYDLEQTLAKQAESMRKVRKAAAVMRKVEGATEPTPVQTSTSTPLIVPSPIQPKG